MFEPKRIFRPEVWREPPAPVTLFGSGALTLNGPIQKNEDEGRAKGRT
jgi:hypothetical protein